VDRVTNERQSIRPEPAQGEPKLRWNWDTPMMLSPHDPATIFVAANKLFRSRDRGYVWEAVSPDLTTNADREELALMGVYGKDTKIAKNDGIAEYPTLVAFAESDLERGLYWAGSEDGLVHVSSDAGVNWTEVSKNVPGLPKGNLRFAAGPSRFRRVGPARSTGIASTTFEPTSMRATISGRAGSASPRAFPPVRWRER
jgi:hypothetical protein